MKYKILVVNPGSTSTKIGVFLNQDILLEETIRHSNDDLCSFDSIIDQLKFRKELIVDKLKEKNIKLDSLSVIVARGGLLKPIEGGTYKVNDLMLKDLKEGKRGEHASNLGAILAYEIASELNIDSYIVDPVVVDELSDIARISGYKGIDRISIFHALNQKAVAKNHAKKFNKAYEDLNLIVVHLGGGVSVGAHEKGKVVEVANALDGEGPFSPERSGGLPVGALARLCFSNKYSLKDVMKMIKGNGGLVSYLDTNSAIEVSERIQAGDKYAELIYRAMAYQISKEIGACSVVLKGHVDGILITGGVAYDDVFVSWIRESVSFISKIFVYPGEDELEALAQGALRVLLGEEELKDYK